MTAQFNPRKSADQTKETAGHDLTDFHASNSAKRRRNEQAESEDPESGFGDGYTQAAADGTNNIRAEFSLLGKF